MSFTFDYNDWASVYPTLAQSYKNEAQASFVFDQAWELFQGLACSKENDPKRIRIMVYLLMEHIIQCGTTNPNGSQSNGGMAGRISSAERGEAHVEADLPGDTSERFTFFNDTEAGRMFVQYLRKYLKMRFIPGRRLRTREFP